MSHAPGPAAGRGDGPRLTVAEVVAAVHRARGERIVIPTMSAVHPWLRLEPHPLDLVYLPSSMGQATALGLGLALACPERGVVVLSGDGSLLMNLGSLVSIVAARARNLTVAVLDNGVYQVTGGQPTPGAGIVDWATLARGAGFEAVFTSDDAADLGARLPAILATPGPVLLWLRVATDPAAPPARAPARHPAARAADLRAALAAARERQSRPPPGTPSR